MPRVPFNPKIGRIKTDAGNFAVDRSFLAHYHLKPATADADGIGAFTLGAGAQTITSGFNAIPEPRNVTITPSAAAVTGRLSRCMAWTCSDDRRIIHNKRHDH